MTEPDHWNTRLTPPPGGLERLAHALATRSEARPHAWQRWPVVIVTACSVCLALGLGVYIRDAPRRTFEHTLQQALAQSVVTTEDESTAPPPLRELPSSRPDVRIVLVALQPMPAHPADG